MMAELIIDITGCTTALQFLDRVGNVLGKPLGNFSVLNHYFHQNYYPQITLVGMEEFNKHCPHATKEMELILKMVQKHYEEEGKRFEYEFKP